MLKMMQISGVQQFDANGKPIPELDASGNPIQKVEDPNDTTPKYTPEGKLINGDSTLISSSMGETKEIDPNILHLEDNLEKALKSDHFKSASHIVRTAIDVSVHGIKWTTLNILDTTAQANLELNDVGAGPGTKCVKDLQAAATKIINYWVNESFFALEPYKNTNWAKRKHIRKIASDNIRDEVCSLEKTLNEFVQMAGPEIHHMGHIGYGLAQTPEPNRRLAEYRDKCRNIIESWPTVPTVPKMSYKEALMSSPPYQMVQPQQQLFVQTYHPVPPPSRGMVYKLGAAVGEPTRAFADGYSSKRKQAYFRA